MTITEFVRNLWENDSYGNDSTLMDLETAKYDLKMFADEGWDLPEDITPENFMETWNEIVRENRPVDGI